MEIVNVMAVSLDGRIGSHCTETDSERRSYQFTDETDRSHVESLIKTADAIVTGAQSVRASRKVWDTCNHHGVPPAWYILTTKGLEADLPFWNQSHVSRCLVSPDPLEGPFPDSEVANETYGNMDAVAFMLSLLQRRGFQRVLLFGGGEINKLFYAAKAVDSLMVTLSPTVVGLANAPFFVNPGLDYRVKFSLKECRPAQNFVFLEYSVLK